MPLRLARCQISSRSEFAYRGPRRVWCCMDTIKTALERAFELAKSGKYANVSDIKSALRAERYSIDTVTGASLSKQLRSLIANGP